MTPAIPLVISASLRYGPLVIFLFVLFVSALRTLVAAATLQHEDGDGDSRPPVNTPFLLSTVSDCLHFLQFIFLTGGLSLSYPGFYPAVVGHFNWFALFTDIALPIPSFVPAPPTAPMRMASTYNRVSDGLYEVNGTYGGSFGLEVMTQMVGTPMSCDTWLQMVIIIMWIVVAMGGFLWILEWVRPKNILGFPMVGHGAGEGIGIGRRGCGLAQATRIGSDVLRLVLSYFTMPLVALSTYQLNLSDMLGAGHLALTLIVLVLTLSACVWLAMRLPAASLGGLISQTRRQNEAPGEIIDAHDEFEERQARRHGRFVTVLFMLNIVRGLVVGGLQHWGVVQLALLVGCEIIMLLAIWVFRPYSVLSSGFMATLSRLTVMVCFIPFIFHPSRLLRLKSDSAYAALSLCGVAMIGVFLLPSCWHFYKLVCWWLGQIQYRNTLRMVCPQNCPHSPFSE
jgi:hypothetical protein